MADRLGVSSLLAKAKYDRLVKKYGDNPEMWEKAGAASLIGAELSEGYSKWANLNLKTSAIKARQEEVQNRAEISVANIAKQGEKVSAAQAGAFVKSGVKLEGSALDVMTETVLQATEAAQVRQREADYEIAQQEVARRVLKAQQQFAPIETILGVASAHTMSKV